MGINNCTPATRQIIKEYLLSVGKAKLTDITDKAQAEQLKDRLKPKCDKGHVIGYAYS